MNRGMWQAEHPGEQFNFCRGRDTRSVNVKLQRTAEGNEQSALLQMLVFIEGVQF